MSRKPLWSSSWLGTVSADCPHDRAGTLQGEGASSNLRQHPQNRVHYPSVNSRPDCLIILKTYRGYDHPSRDSTLMTIGILFQSVCPLSQYVWLC